MCSHNDKCYCLVGFHSNGFFMCYFADTVSPSFSGQYNHIPRHLFILVRILDNKYFIVHLLELIGNLDLIKPMPLLVLLTFRVLVVHKKPRDSSGFHLYCIMPELMHYCSL